MDAVRENERDVGPALLPPEADAFVEIIGVGGVSLDRSGGTRGVGEPVKNALGRLDDQFWFGSISIDKLGYPKPQNPDQPRVGHDGNRLVTCK